MTTPERGSLGPTALALPPLPERLESLADALRRRRWPANADLVREAIARIAELGEALDQLVNSNTTRAHQLNAAEARIAELEQQVEDLGYEVMEAGERNRCDCC